MKITVSSSKIGVITLLLLISFLLFPSMRVLAAGMPVSFCDKDGVEISSYTLDYSTCESVEKDGEIYYKLDLPTPPEVENYIFVGWSPHWKNVDAFSEIYILVDDEFVSYRSLYYDNSRSAILSGDIWTTGTPYGCTDIRAKYYPSICNITIKDAYYEADGTTLIETKERLTDAVRGNSDFSYSALEEAGFTCIGHCVGLNPSVRNLMTVSSTAQSANMSYTFVYVKNESSSTGGRIDIPVETEADGTTKTDFTVDNLILGGDLVVSIPAEMILAYDSDKEIMTKEDYVSATGRCASTSKLEIKTLTSITYTNEKDNNIKVPGTIAFGTASEDYQITEWSALELLTGVKIPADVVKKNIAASVLKSDIDFVGTYSTTILYNISVLGTTENDTI